MESHLIMYLVLNSDSNKFIIKNLTTKKTSDCIAECFQTFKKWKKKTTHLTQTLQKIKEETLSQFV